MVQVEFQYVLCFGEFVEYGIEGMWLVVFVVGIVQGYVGDLYWIGLQQLLCLRCYGCCQYDQYGQCDGLDD